jgi:cytochrome c-type biogenesis protein CcmH
VAALAKDAPLADPELERRALDLHKEIRCLVCQNQSIAESNAELAGDLRRLVRERLAAGDGEAEVKAWLAARYGDWVLLAPPLKPVTWALWFGPAALLLAAGLGVGFWHRRGRKTAPPAPLDAAERRRLDALLAEED